MLRRKTFWIVLLLILLAAAGGGYYYYQNLFLPSQAQAEADPLQTARVRQGDLTVSASGAGSLVPAQEAALGFRSGGVLVEVSVQPGDPVAAGQVLARLDDGEVRAQLAQAEASLHLAELKLTGSEAAVAQTEANLRLAQLKLDELLADPDAAALAVARANLDSAQADLAALLAGPTDDEITIALADLEQAAINVQQAQAAYDKVAWAGDVGTSPQAAALQAATLAYQKALATYQQKVAGPTAAQIAAAEAKVAQARQQYEALLEGADAADVAAAQIGLEQAQMAREAAQRDVAAAEIGRDQAQLAVEAARRDLAALELRAPFAGTVTAVNASPGETVGTAPLVTLADLSRIQIEFYLDETDLDKLAVGHSVEVEFDALPDLIFPGEVVRINPTLVVVDGVPAASALAALEPPTTNPAAARLMPGMNAAVEVIAGRTEDALLVPVEALRELGPGQYAVFVLVDQQPTLRPVEVGLQDFTYAEILSGLEQGDVVTTGTVATE